MHFYGSVADFETVQVLYGILYSALVCVLAKGEATTLNSVFGVFIEMETFEAAVVQEQVLYLLL